MYLYKSFKTLNERLNTTQNVNISIGYKIFKDIFCIYLKM